MLLTMFAWDVARDGAVAVLTLYRPPINALDRDALAELRAAVAVVAADSAVRALVVASALSGVFCSGGDLKYWRTVRDADDVARAGREAFAALADLDVPTIAAVDGQVIGDALGLVLSCDVRLASADATVALPELRYGFVPGWGTVGGLVATVGRARAAELLLGAGPIDAHRAREIGLLTDVVDGGRFPDAVHGRARALAALSPAAVAALRCALRGGDEHRCFRSVWGGADWAEGIDALFTRRAPVFGARRSA